MNTPLADIPISDSLISSLRATPMNLKEDVANMAYTTLDRIMKLAPPKANWAHYQIAIHAFLCTLAPHGRHGHELAFAIASIESNFLNFGQDYGFGVSKDMFELRLLHMTHKNGVQESNSDYNTRITDFIKNQLQKQQLKKAMQDLQTTKKTYKKGNKYKGKN